VKAVSVPDAEQSMTWPHEATQLVAVSAKQSVSQFVAVFMEHLLAVEARAAVAGPTGGPPGIDTAQGTMISPQPPPHPRSPHPPPQPKSPQPPSHPNNSQSQPQPKSFSQSWAFLDTALV
jgi:hypothetical protein